jgi:hypothetical protein
MWSWSCESFWLFRRVGFRLSVPMRVPVTIQKVYCCPKTQSLIVEGIQTPDPPFDSRLPVTTMTTDSQTFLEIK